MQDNLVTIHEGQNQPIQPIPERLVFSNLRQKPADIREQLESFFSSGRYAFHEPILLEQLFIQGMRISEDSEEIYIYLFGTKGEVLMNSIYTPSPYEFWQFPLTRNSWDILLNNEDDIYIKWYGFASQRKKAIISYKTQRLVGYSPWIS